ncbi:MAG: ABC transporter ATP-binding protein [Deltaproteobacteria bacterium]|nr:MAG: ABC transporter ATP-binding protein [Deltaproteobacteria bacterium]
MSEARRPSLEACGLRVRRVSRRNCFELRVDALSLDPGELLAVIGPNGAGKTTLLQALAGLLPLEAGELRFADAQPPVLVFQRPIALVGSVAHNVRSALRGARLERAAVAARVTEALAHFGIAELAQRRAHGLSGGELRRLALARAFARRPSALLLDEPFEDLDRAAQDGLIDDLERVTRRAGLAVALVTHDLRRAVRVADRLAVLREGRLEQIGALDEVLQRPGSPRIARLVGMTNLLPGVARPAPSGLAVDVDGEHCIETRAPPGAFAPGAPVWAGLRPEHIKIDIGRGAGVPIGKGAVERVRSDGALCTVALRWSGHEIQAHLVAGRGLARTIAAGDGVLLSVRPEDVHVLPREA